MNTRSLAGLLLALLMALIAASCGGSSAPNPGPGPGPGFTRMTAVVLDAAGNPMEGLSVRVDGTGTGVTTDANGQFILDADDFPGGITVAAELAFGKAGIVLGTREVVPVENPNLQVRFGDGSGGGTASVSGTVYDGSAYGVYGKPEFAGDANMPMLPPTPLAGVEITLFDAAAGAVFQTSTDSAGGYSFANVAAGNWQLTARLDGYYPEMAALRVEDGVNSIYDFALIQKGVVAPGEGFKVSGTLKDSQSGAPIANATINLYADTGYYGYDIRPDVGMPPAPGSTDPAVGGGGASEPGKAGMMMPDLYRPQYQTVTTGSDGSFAFAEEVAGYSLWLDYRAEGYLAGNHWEEINGRSADLNLNLTLEPVVATAVSGRVLDGNGNGVPGARLEFIFASGMFGTGGPAVPGFMNLDDMANTGTGNFDNGTGPVPGRDVPPSDSGSAEGWDSSNDAPAAGGPAAPGGGGGSSSGGGAFDNSLMQRFLWEQQQKGASGVPADFSGYVLVYADENGNYSAEDIPAGDWYVMVSAYRHLPYAGDVKLEADPGANVLDVTIPAVPVGSVEGRVIDENGNPVPDCLVNATQPNVDPFTYTNANGMYRIDNVPTGDWLISAFKSGYLTATQMTPITENGVAIINLQLNRYEGPAYTTIAFGGNVINGYDNSAVGGADIVFTPVDETMGGWARHIQSGSDGKYNTNLVPDTDYNVLIQKSGFEDIFFRFWTDSSNPRMEFWLWPVGAPGGNGGWNGGRPGPGTDPATGSPDGSVTNNR